MSKSKTPSLPAAPTSSGYLNQLGDLGGKLTSGDFSGNLSWLQDLTSYNPETTKLALESAQGFLTPAYQQTNQDITNQLASMGALQSSTYSDALAKNAFNLQSQYQGITSQAALNDVYNANQNKMSLFGTGLDALQSAGTNINQFNLANYENQVAAALSGQKQQTGGWLGALTGGAGGAALGLALAPFTGGSSLLLAGLGGSAGALAGGLGSQGTGGQLLNTGVGAYGMSMPFQKSFAPGSTASNNPFKISGSLGGSDILNKLQLSGYGLS